MPSKGILIAGPTASGKSALALGLAERLNGSLINADSLQIYRDLRVLSARPTPEEERRAPHYLYGTMDGATACSVGHWLTQAQTAIETVRAAGRVPIVVGGTGLYLKAALEGIAAIPEVPPWARTQARDLLATEGPAALHARLQERDPVMAARLRPTDSQRLARAWEVLTGTGRSLSAWWDLPAQRPGLPGDFAVLVLDPPRETLRAACDARLAHMVADGALDELAALLARALDPALPVMRAVGVPELSEAVRGARPLPEALSRAQAATRQYAKRQATWIRHQLRADAVIPRRWGTQDLESPSAELDNFIRSFILTPLS